MCPRIINQTVLSRAPFFCFASLVDLDHRVKPDGDEKGADASPTPDGDDIGKREAYFTHTDTLRCKVSTISSLSPSDLIGGSRWKNLLLWLTWTIGSSPMVTKSGADASPIPDGDDIGRNAS